MSEAVLASWRPTSAWAISPGGYGNRTGEPGVRLRPIEGVPLATIIARAGGQAALAGLVRAHLGCDLPSTGKSSFGPRGDIVWSAPGQWLVVGDTSGLREVCADLAAVTDQSSSRSLIEVSGPAARDALAKGFAIDLHPTVFATGDTAVTAVSHMSVQIWQADDGPRFLIAVPRSLTGSFQAWLDHACAAYGYEVSA